jgi:hypothetical protein
VGLGHTREHTFRGIAASIARARETLGYAPRFSSLEALHEALAWLVAHGQVDVAASASRDGLSASPAPPAKRDAAKVADPSTTQPGV